MVGSLPFPAELRETPKNVIAVVSSVVLNLSGMYLAGVLASWNGAETAPEPEEPVNEVVLNLEELIPKVMPPEAEAPDQPDQKAFLNTYADQESAVAPKNARFESDRNTLAMTEKAASDPAAEAVPSQDGEKIIPFMELQEHRYKEGPDAEIPRTPQSVPGLPVPQAMMPKMPGEETPEAETPDRPMEPRESENREDEADVSDPKAKEFVQMPSEQGTEEAKKRDAKAGEDGGSPETLEMANVDVAKMVSALADKLDILDETAMVEPDKRDAMPERSPELVNPSNPLFQAPAPPPSAPLRAQPIARSPQEAMAPLPPGAMASQPTNGTADEAAFSPERHRNQMKGSLSNIGRTAAMDAEATPLGQYKKLVSRAIERRWHQLRLQNESFLSFGSLKIRFEVTRSGRVHGLRVIHEDANAVMTNFSLQAIHSAEIPPMPEEIVNLVGNDGLEVTYDIIIY